MDLVLFTDSAHLKANSNKLHYTKKIEQDTQNYIKDLNEAIQVDQGEYCKKPYQQAEKEIATVQLILKMDIWIVKINRRVSFT